MYTRAYGEDGAITLPEGYGGTMLDNNDYRPEPECIEAAAPQQGPLGGLFGGLSSLSLPFLSKDIHIGSEEVLIAAVALFLLFSKNGDKECAIMLLLTLFVAK